MTPCGTTTIRAPPLNTVGTTPGGIFNDLHLMSGVVKGEIFSVIAQSDIGVTLNIVNCIGKGHFTKLVMMAVSLAISCNVNYR